MSQAATSSKTNRDLQELYDFIDDNFDQIAKNKTVVNLTKDELSSLIAKLDPNKIHGPFLFKAVLDWSNHDVNRLPEFSSLFLTLDLHQFPLEFVEDVIATEDMVKNCELCLNALVAYFVSKAKERRKKKFDSKIICVGGLDNKAVSEVYCEEENSDFYPNLPFNLSRHCALRHNNFVYCIGGAIDCNPLNITNKVFRMNLKTNPLEWHEMAPMIEKRCDFGAAVYEGCIVAAGGCNGDSRSNTVEAFEGRSNQWRKIASLKYRRDDLSLVAAGGGNGGLFAIGGWDGRKNKSVERLDSLSMNWKEVSSMNTARRCFAAVYCNGFIYVIGGWPAKALNAAEKYDPINDQWCDIMQMNAGRWRHSACVYQEKLFVVGGENSKKAEKKIECYDHLLDEWNVVDEVKEEYFDHVILSL